MTEPQPAPRYEAAARVAVLLAAAVIALASLAALHLARLPSPPPVSDAAVAPAASVETAPAPADRSAGAAETSAGSAAPVVRADPAWVERIAASTGIPSRALAAYAAADLVVDAEQPACGIGWNTLAAIGAIESDHGRHGGSIVAEDGWVSPRILGLPLNGDGVAAIHDTDGGEWDDDTTWDRAVGPMQFIPETWSHWGPDGNGDGISDPNHIDDAALGAARYLCASGPMSTPEGWRDAVFSYNHLDSYVDDVAAAAGDYARKATP